MTCVASVILFFTISDFPEEVTWLSAEEKDFVKARLHADVGQSRRHDPLTLRSVLNVFKDCELVSLMLDTGAIAYSSCRQDNRRRFHVFRAHCTRLRLWYAGTLPFASIEVLTDHPAYFAPSIIQGLGHNAIRTQLLSVPPWACAFTLAMLTAIASDHLRHRFVFVLLPTAVSLTGFLILLIVHDNTKLQYAALFLSAMGTYSAMPIIVCWFNTNLGGHHRRAVGTAWQVGFGNSAYTPCGSLRQAKGLTCCVQLAVSSPCTRS